MGGSDPTFRPFGPKSPREVAPAHRRNIQRRVFWPRRHRERKENGTRRRRRKQVTSDSEQRVILKRMVRLEQRASELLEDYARFIGISAEDALNIVLRKMMANDTDFQNWIRRQRDQQQDSQLRLVPSASVEEMEAA